MWNDQPPLHTFLITQVLRHVSPSITGPRLVTTAFTVRLLISVIGIVRRVSGLISATLATGLLLGSPGFLELSSSCMLEIPALAAAVTGLCLLVVGPGRGRPGEDRRDAGTTLVAAMGAGLLFGVALCALAWMTGRVYLQIRGIRHSPQTYSSLVLGEIVRLRPYTEWLFTHEPLIPFTTVFRCRRRWPWCRSSGCGPVI